MVLPMRLLLVVQIHKPDDTRHGQGEGNETLRRPSVTQPTLTAALRLSDTRRTNRRRPHRHRLRQQPIPTNHTRPLFTQRDLMLQRIHQTLQRMLYLLTDIDCVLGERQRDTHQQMTRRFVQMLCPIITYTAPLPPLAHVSNTDRATASHVTGRDGPAFLPFPRLVLVVTPLVTSRPPHEVTKLSKRRLGWQYWVPMASRHHRQRHRHQRRSGQKRSQWTSETNKRGKIHIVSQLIATTPQRQRQRQRQKHIKRKRKRKPTVVHCCR